MNTPRNDTAHRPRPRLRICRARWSPERAGHHPGAGPPLPPRAPAGATVLLLLAERLLVHRPRSRPMSSFMISLEPAQIFVTRASIHARATRYSVM